MWFARWHLVRLLRRASKEMRELGDAPCVGSFNTCRELGDYLSNSADELKTGENECFHGLWEIFVPTCKWDDAGGSQDVGNSVFTILDQIYFPKLPAESVVCWHEMKKLLRCLPLPPLLERLIAENKWNNPGKVKICHAIPFITHPLVFLTHREMMVFESNPSINAFKNEDERFHHYRGSFFEHRDLPWIDVEKTLFIAVNEIPGDDAGIALDFRPGLECPRVIAGDWQSGDAPLIHREVAPNFDEFVKSLGLDAT